MKSDFDAVLEMAQSMLMNQAKNGAVEHGQIQTTVDLVLGLQAQWRASVDRSEIISTLEERLNQWVGRATALVSNTDHVAWLTSERKKGWRLWARYKQSLNTTWSPFAIEALDDSTDQILELLEDPTRNGAFDRRGLVVGEVQSGKTANYTGLICKAADAGYKVIIVLAGAHTSLRSQTQMRLDEGFLGYETKPFTAAGAGATRAIGVGLIDTEPSIRPDYLTNRSENGDFSRAVANSAGVTPTPGGRPILLVVKKNGSVLKNLVSWIEDRVADVTDEESGRQKVAKVPLLVIDDEADHYSVDTGDQAFDANGNPDPDYDPKTINRHIRRIVSAFQKTAYVGYTATPFANIFIHAKARTREEGEDLFPRSFILNLPSSSSYCGPATVFGTRDLDRNETTSEGLDLTRVVSDYAASRRLDERVGWMPPIHRRNHVPVFNGAEQIPDSLDEAIRAFLLSTAARRVRLKPPFHSSMLIHVTRLTDVQDKVKEQVDRRLVEIRRGLEFDSATELSRMRALWEKDFVETTKSVKAQLADETITDLPWEAVAACLLPVAKDVKVRQIDGSAGDILDYETHKQTGLTVIAVGGDKLSRGLTLEGLSVSYFLRASKMYDTLMQMGRWFGYRPRYVDLCRLYTSSDLVEWFEHIADASEELRQEFNYMVNVRSTPEEYGLKVRSHPILAATSKVKMRNGIQLQLSFAGAMEETVVFDRSRSSLQDNLIAMTTLLGSAGSDVVVGPSQPRPGQAASWAGSVVWRNVPSEAVSTFLRNYKTLPSTPRVKPEIMARFIEQQVRIGELTTWTVAVLTGEASEPPVTIAGHQLNMVKRSVNTRSLTLEEQIEQNKFLIRRVLSPRDETIDLDQDQWAAALRLSVAEFDNGQASKRRKARPDAPSGKHVREVRGLGDPTHAVPGHPERGLLLLYPLNPAHGKFKGWTDPVVGFGVSFPASRNAQKVAFTVNNIYYDQEFGPGNDDTSEEQS